MNSLHTRSRPPGRIILAVALSATALAVEACSHICAQFFFDPLPDPIAWIAYAFLPVMLLINEWVLHRTAPQQKPLRGRAGRFLPNSNARHLLVWATLGTALALGISALYAAMFAPILPIAVVALAIGIGIFPWSPFLNLGLLWSQSNRLRERRRATGLAPHARLRMGIYACAATGPLLVAAHPLASGMTIGCALTTRDNPEVGVAAIRSLHADTYLHDLCFTARPPLWVWIGQLVTSPLGTYDARAARRLYYLVTGEPYTQSPPSRRVRHVSGLLERDPVESERGGELVGTALPGLSLTTSTIEGVLDPNTETAYSRWTLVFRNDSDADQEARAELLLPDGAVVDQASLWIDGKEHPAAFGEQGQVKAAYQSVAVVQRRDPLLVTYRARDRVQVQCFPVPRRRTMQIRIGMTCPLIWEHENAPYLALTPPSLQHVNFSIPRDVRHTLWYQSTWPSANPSSSGVTLEGNGWQLTPASSTRGDSDCHDARLAGGARELLIPPSLRIHGWRRPEMGTRGAPGWVRAFQPLKQPEEGVDLVVVVDRSRGMSGAFPPVEQQRLGTALARYSRSRFVVLDAREVAGTSHPPLALWLDARGAAREISRVANRPCVGGLESGPILQRAWDLALRSGRPAAVLWVHGPNPPELEIPDTLDQALEASDERIPLVGVLCRPGPDALLQALSSHRAVHALSLREGREIWEAATRMAHIAALLAGEPTNALPPGSVPLGGSWPPINGVYTATEFGSIPIGSPTSRSFRLALASHIQAHWRLRKAGGTQALEWTRLGVGHRLVTPYTGAVVLERKEQYEAIGLSNSVNEDAIPSVPEPSLLALLGAGGVTAGLRRVWKKRGVRGRDAMGEAGSVETSGAQQPTVTPCKG